MKMQPYYHRSWLEWRKCLMLRKDFYPHSTGAPPRLQREKAQCNYNNIIAFHQSTVTHTATWICRLEMHRLRQATGLSYFNSCTTCAGGEGRRCKTEYSLVRHFYCQYFKSSVVFPARIVRTHAGVSAHRVVVLPWLDWTDRGRIQKNISRGQHMMFTKHLCRLG